MERQKRWTNNRSNALGMARILVGVCVAAIYRPAHAEGGEIAPHLSVFNEMAKLRHPAATYANGGSTWTYVPRFGARVSYGVSHWLSVSVGADASLARSVVAEGVAYQGLRQGDLYASYLGIFVPAAVAIHFTRGSDWSVEIMASAGPSFSRWQDDFMLKHGDDPESLSASRLPVRSGAAWYADWFGRLGLVATWRPVDWGALTLGPYAGASLNQDLFLGIFVEGSLIWGLGPHL